MAILLKKRIDSCFLLLCRYSADKRVVEYILDCHVHFGTVVKINGLPVLNFASFCSFVSNYRAPAVFAVQVPSRAH